MTAFGLDDVRESYTGDVTRFLAEVESSANSVVSNAALAFPAERSWQPPVDSMVVGLHGIVGSSSLIGLDTMASSARRLEAIAGCAAESLRMLTWHATRLERIATLCLDGAADLRVILEHELAGRTADARQRCAALSARLDSTVSSLDGPPSERVAPDPGRPPAVFAAGTQLIKIPAIPPLPGPADPRDSGWDDAAPGGEPAAAARELGGSDDELDEELRSTFREEARETLHNLQGYWLRLDHQADDREAATHCARLLHLLKGTAATVGFDAIARAAGELHAWFETVRAQRLTAAVIQQLGRDIEDLVEQTLGDRPKLPHAVAEPVGSPSQPGDDEPRQIFLEEARRALDELWSVLRQVQATSGIARGVAATGMERLFHRLKGSALIVDEGPIAEVAARGQAMCEALEQIDPTAVEALVQHIASLIGQPPGPASSAGDAVPYMLALPPAEEWEAFLEESSALLDDLDGVLAKLERSAKPAEELSTLFRLYHTLKGTSNSVGLAPVGQQLHIIETFLERIVAAPALPDLRQVASALASEHATMRASIARAAEHTPFEVDHGRTTARLAVIRERSSSSWIAASDPVWAPASDAMVDGHGSGASRSYASHASQATDDGSTAAGEPSLGDEAVGARRYVRVAADRLDGLLDLVGELVVARSRILTRVERMQGLHDEDQDRHSAVMRQVDDFVASTRFANLDGRRARFAAAGGARSGALDLDRYEEIHVLSRQLDESGSDLAEMRREIGGEMQRLTEDAEALGTIVTDLQTEITQARMLAIETLFARLQLPIRDAAQRLGRDIEIVTRGEDVAIDKAISDALFGPLLHIVRNAVVHGIEPPARRSELGKPRAGTISLVARQHHAQVVLEVSDDGRGIDVARLKAIGVERGLIDPATPETDPRVLELVFVHGVSTSDEAGQVAGRGVGGSVIRRAVDRLNGTIEITTDRDTGTRFRITLPLSMSITQALIVRSAGVTLAIPLAFAEMILLRDGVEVVDTFGCMRALVGGTMMPVHVTRRLFGDPQDPLDGVLVVCAVGSERIAIHADEVLGQEEIVVKGLGSLLDGHPQFSGSTQRGDGELVLILDVPGALAAETSVQGAAAAAPRTVAQRPSPAPRATPAAFPAPVLDAGPLALGEPARPVPDDRLRVLFVDDSLSVRKVAERMLLSLGVEVVTAVDGQDALDKLRTTSFSLVFTDLEMPRVHGYELIREMRYLPAYSEIPVVVISSRSGQKHVDQALGMGAREYLTKPFSPEILNAVLSRLTRLESPS
jgi:chemosensory pili system protein ChpA (sensor histidine kinase/response regulator)